MVMVRDIVCGAVPIRSPCGRRIASRGVCLVVMGISPFFGVTCSPRAYGNPLQLRPPPLSEGRPVRDAGSVSHNAAIESIAARDADREPAPFAGRVPRGMERRGFFGAGRRVVLGDGAAWIRDFADEHVPDAVQIVDIFHETRLRTRPRPGGTR